MKAILAVLVGLSCTPALADERAMDLPIGDPARKEKQAAVVLDGITDTARGDVLTPPELAARLDGVGIAFVGESHTDMDFHRAQLRVVQELHKRGRRVLIGLEMYPVTEQAALDRWTSEKGLTEDAFVRESRWYGNWGYHWNYYRDIFLFARANGLRMFALNVPRTLVQTVRVSGFDALPPDQKAMLPPRVDTLNEEHRRLFRAFFGAEDALHGNMPDAVFEGMFRAQCTWDAAMGWNAIRALKNHGGPEAILVGLIGAGHVAYGLGAERQSRPWFDGRIASVIPVPVADSDHPQPLSKVQASYASFVWGLPPATDPLYPSLGIATPEQKGAGGRYKVIMVAQDSPAEAAGFKVGDELVSFDGVAVDDKETTNRLMSEKRWGDAVVYKVMREGKELTLTAYLRRKAPKPPAGAGAEKPSDAPRGPMPSTPPVAAPRSPSGGGR